LCYDVVSAEYLADYKIRVTFTNKKKGVMDFLPYIKKGGIYSKLQDLNFFKQFEINKDLGILTWGNEIDIAPETLYSEVTGDPLPEWMYPVEEMKTPG